MELTLLGILILGLTYMASKIKPNSVNLNLDNLDMDTLINKLAKAIAKEIAQELNKKSGSTSFRTTEWEGPITSSISMDDSIIPMKVDTSKLESNIENLAKEEIKVDKDLEKNKAKLANLKKKKE